MYGNQQVYMNWFPFQAGNNHVGDGTRQGFQSGAVEADGGFDVGDGGIGIGIDSIDAGNNGIGVSMGVNVGPGQQLQPQWQTLSHPDPIRSEFGPAPSGDPDLITHVPPSDNAQPIFPNPHPPVNTMSQDTTIITSPSSSGQSNATPSQTPSPHSESLATSRRPSSSRALVPTPLSTNITPKIPLATASSPVNELSNPSPVGGGPTSASYVVPPRPKPGRKPATDEPASKRKAQNRESQRAFRARKAAKLNEMQIQVESAEMRHKKELNDRASELNERNMRIHRLEQALHNQEAQTKNIKEELEYWKRRCLEAEQRRQSKVLEPQTNNGGFTPEKQSVYFPNSGPEVPDTDFNTPKTLDIGCGKCKVDGECMCIADIAKMDPINAFMPAVSLSRAPSRTDAAPRKTRTRPVDEGDIFAEREIDFTAQFSAKRHPTTDVQPSTAFMAHSSDAENCGFCTDDGNCMCRDASLRIHDSQRSDDEVVSSRVWIGPDEVKQEPALVGPGSCADCQANPRQRAWCQRVAQLRNEATEWRQGSSSRKSSIGSPLETMEPPVDTGSLTPRLDSRRSDSVTQSSSIGCSDAYRLFEGRVSMDSDRMDWISNLRPVASGNPKADINMEPRKYSALELDTAGVIATLQNSMSPLVPRKSDGENAKLVRLASEIRRTSSPRTSVESDSLMPISSLVNSTDSPSRNWR